ncbi:MAG: AAA family ATPase, partial [Betaproteobacteria bacterium]|nr:AAA family ATPase [Betaproteobacteria bacterium]
ASVIVWSGEDDPGDTLVPRLIAAGADLRHVHIVGDVLQDGQRCAFDPARDVPKLAAACAGIDNIAMLIVDPLVSAVSGDSHKNAEVRRGLAPLVELAARLDAALLGITHFTKGTQGREPLERVSGSLAFGALARVVLGTVREPMNPDDPSAPRSLVVARAKSNIGLDGDGFRYAFEQFELPKHPGVHASRIAWGNALKGPASSLLSEPEKPKVAHSEAADAASFLRELLADEPMTVRDVKKAADDAGYSWRTVQRAMKKAGVISKRQGARLPALWSIPGHTLAPVAPTTECESWPHLFEQPNPVR